VQVKGRAQPLAIYTLLAAARDAAFEKLAEAQARFLAAYRQQEFGPRLAANSPPAAIWRRNWASFTICSSGASPTGLRLSPPAEWDGVFVAVSKTG